MFGRKLLLSYRLLRSSSLKTKSCCNVSSMTDTPISRSDSNYSSVSSRTRTRTRCFSTDNPVSNFVKEKGELKLKEKLSLHFPPPSIVHVEDISGGCGSMYQIHVEANEFNGLSTISQHQLITKVLSDEIKSMHGIRISTKILSDVRNKGR